MAAFQRFPHFLYFQSNRGGVSQLFKGRLIGVGVSTCLQFYRRNGMWHQHPVRLFHDGVEMMDVLVLDNKAVMDWQYQNLLCSHMV